eukprot:scaffold537_cov241-Pinguiococcus_pyrenoidosus.AAC.2
MPVLATNLCTMYSVQGSISARKVSRSVGEIALGPKRMRMPAKTSSVQNASASASAPVMMLRKDTRTCLAWISSAAPATRCDSRRNWRARFLNTLALISARSQARRKPHPSRR